VDSEAECDGRVVADDADSDVKVLFLFFLSALLDRVALVASFKPAGQTQTIDVKL